MSDSEILLKAAMNRIYARITKKMINSAQEFSDIAEEIPQRIQEEWSNFKEEVIEESERISNQNKSSEGKYSKQQLSREDLIQAQIDKLRSKVIETNKSIEERN